MWKKTGANFISKTVAKKEKKKPIRGKLQMKERIFQFLIIYLAALGLVAACGI